MNVTTTRPPRLGLYTDPNTGRAYILVSRTKDDSNLAHVQFEDTGNAAKFGNTVIGYSNIQDVVFNSLNEENRTIGAAAVLNVRTVDSPSPISGADRYRTLDVVFAPDALDDAKKFVAHVKELNIPIKETAFPNTVFQSVFFAGKP